MLAYWDIGGCPFGMREPHGSKTLGIQVMPGHGIPGKILSWEVEPLHLVNHLHFSQGGNWINLKMFANSAAVPPVTLGSEAVLGGRTLPV